MRRVFWYNITTMVSMESKQFAAQTLALYIVLDLLEKVRRTEKTRYVHGIMFVIDSDYDYFGLIKMQWYKGQYGTV